MWAFLSRNRDAGLLLLRVALGGFFIWAHGWSKLAGGIERWTSLGRAMEHVGISFWPAMWGFLGTMAETLGVLLFAVGLFFRPACLVLTITMTIAAITSYSNAKSGALSEASHAIELGVVFFSMMFIGAGKYSVDRD
jgi:putative oxidoreductase